MESWGPPLWNIIHGIAYYSARVSNASSGSSGSSGSRLLVIDERREFHWLIKHLEMVIPCQECRRHCISYRATHPIELSQSSVKWAWEFHEAVNTRLKKSGFEFSDDIGKDAKVSDMWRAYLKSLETYILTGKLVRKDVVEFGRHLGLWLRFAT